jgi:hypothetical protein
MVIAMATALRAVPEITAALNERRVNAIRYCR